ncbi:MAG: DUF6363 domain-containing protein [Patescibacteria group bacterium]
MKEKNTKKIALVGEGGGTRNSFASGVMIGTEIFPEKFSTCFGVSSAFGNFAYFVSCQREFALSLWTSELTSRDVFSWSRLASLKRPADIDHLVDKACASLDRKAVVNSKTRLVGVVARLVDGQTLYVDATEKNIDSLFKATCALPILAKPIKFANGFCVDGGLTDPLPVVEAYRQGFRKMLVIRNKHYVDPYEKFDTPIVKILRRSPQYAKAIKQRIEKHAKTLAFLKNPPNDLEMLIIAPQTELPCGRFDKSVEKVTKAFEIGVEQGKQMKEQVDLFLSN